MAVISLDIDGTCARFVAYAMSVINAEFGTHYSENDMVAWDPMEFLPTAHAELFMRVVKDPATYGHLEVFPGVLDLANSLYDQVVALRGYKAPAELVNLHNDSIPASDPRLIFASHRPPESALLTYEWLVGHGFCFDEVHVGMDVKNEILTKHQNSGVIFVDDDPGLGARLKLPKPPSKLYLLSTPYLVNDPTGVYMVCTWPTAQAEIMKGLLEISNSDFAL